ncbi:MULTISPECIES: TIGR01906 family membrane protein [Thermoanaerobacterium]|uniref:Integral membrane protein n=2 Tax=Thermoanaerobacterium TaxID=28895 RepID=W9E7I4_9THEO|nr:MULTISPECIES: TIGR01906 family membrane protein [Thermoanaerobacterium]AFK86228.1 integral membrane protein TIGR01906 [Thermoanaerobacterium saccharolyticum JW/SL-YS485]ETO37428.1 integral membrane protein [Thermoanaerobacterium aotearoense SCUT27]
MKVTNKTVSIIMTVLLFLIVLLSNLQYLAFNLNFYINEFDKYGVKYVTGMDKSQLSKVALRIQDYLYGKSESLQIDAVIDGRNQKVFDERELEHMKDVRNLFKNGFLLRNLMIIIYILAFLFLYFRKEDVFYHTYRGMLFVILFLLVTGAIVSLDFNKWFIYFHHIFFDNNLWQLDVARDRLIQMLPEGFFSDISYLTFRNSIITYIIIGFVSFLLKGKKDSKIGL